MSDQQASAPDGYCRCGCGQKTNVYKGQVRLFVHGHNGRGDPSARFWARVDVRQPDQCWEWPGHIMDNGYGQFAPHRLVMLAHRFAYQDCAGQIPAGFEIDHLCRNRACVNPAHLEAVTRSENIRRALPFRPPKTHCVHGHPLTADNVYTNGTRSWCRACRAARSAERYRSETSRA